MESLVFENFNIIDANTIQGEMASITAYEKLTIFTSELLEDELEGETQNESGEVKLIYKDGQWTIDSLIDGNLAGLVGGIGTPRE